jgi:hypothetical protein
MGERFILVPGFRGSSPGLLDLLLWACDKQGSASWWEHMVEEAVSIMASRKHREEGRGQGVIVPFQGIPPVT